MIKFFRRIRQNLLSENKFTKYFIYAIGEIILVVIGILIALQINNKSQFNKERAEEIVLLTNLSGEVDLDVLQIENNTRLSEERLVRLDSILRLLKEPERIDKAQFLENSYQFIIDNYFKSNSGIFDEAVSSGKMSYIQNEGLRQSIFDYYRVAKESYTDGTTRQVTDEFITPLLVKHLLLNLDGFALAAIDVEDISNLQPLNLEALKSNTDFWEMVLLKFGSNREQMIRWRGIKYRAEQLKEAIDAELLILRQ